jgi:hypothetical protein
MQSGKFNCSDSQWILVKGDFEDSLLLHLQKFKQSLLPLFGDELQYTCGSPETGKTLLTIVKDDSVQDDGGFKLQNREQGLYLTASNEAGVMYGLQAVTQIFDQCGCTLPGFIIEDWPDFKIRGFLLDIRNGRMPSMETFYTLIDKLAGLRINMLQLAFEHNFEFSGHVTAWQNASPLTVEEAILLDQYCRERYIELVPFQNSFGHAERWLIHDEYKYLGECPDGGFTFPWGDIAEHGTMFAPNEQTLGFLNGLYREILPCFKSSTLNIGCDETWELGEGKSRDICNKKGKYRIYLDFLIKLRELAGRYGKNVQFWADMIVKSPELIKDIPNDMTALIWGYESRHPFAEQCRLFAENHKKFFVCPGTSSFHSITGRSDNARLNILSAVENGLEYSAEGFLNTDWEGSVQMLSIAYIPLALGACYSWGLEQNRDIDPAEAANRLIFKENTSELAEYYWQLGNLADIICSQHVVEDRNILICLWEKRISLEQARELGISPDKIRHFLDELKNLKLKMTNLIVSGSENQLCKREFIHAADMAELAALMGGELLAPDTERKKYMRSLLQQILIEHQNIWLLRNRIGGLRQTLNKLTNKMDFYHA